MYTGAWALFIFMDINKQQEIQSQIAEISTKLKDTETKIAEKTKEIDETTAKINNLLDREYSEYVVDNFVRAYQPSPERNFLLTASVKF